MANPTISDVPDLLKLWDSERNDNIGHDPSKITRSTWEEFIVNAINLTQR